MKIIKAKHIQPGMYTFNGVQMSYIDEVYFDVKFGDIKNNRIKLKLDLFDGSTDELIFEENDLVQVE